MQIGLIPLDERPVNTRYPFMIAPIAGVELVEPPLEQLSSRRQPADHEALAAWLRAQAPTLDALIVSLEMFAYGGLIASRTTDDPASVVVARLNTLRDLKRQFPALSIYAFNLITRISRSDDSFEEPLYWAEYGSRFFRYSQLMDRALQGQEVSAELASLSNTLPAQHQVDFWQRRLRNHIVNLTALELTADDVFDLLVLSSDDTSEYGVGTREKRWLTEWVGHLTTREDAHLLMYPGADEVGSALLGHAINTWHGLAPRFAVQYAIPGDEAVTAPFEDGPVRVTVERQVRAVGGVFVDHPDDADLILAVNTPSREYPVEWPDPAAIEGGRAHRTQHLTPFVAQIAAWIAVGKRVIVADVAYPNGADPVLVDLLRARVDLSQLAAYGAWNTAGNTIGVALAQGVAAPWGNREFSSDAERTAQEHFLTHRFVEDWGYQSGVRQEVGDWLRVNTVGKSDKPEDLDAVKTRIEQGLQAKLAELPGLGTRWRIRPGSVRLPWDRLFEVDFDLEQVAQA